MSTRCGRAGTGAFLRAQRATTSQSAARVSLCPCSRPHRLRVSGPLRCSPAHSHGLEERLVGKKENNEEWEALKAVIADVFRPLLRNIAEIWSIRRALDLEDYQIGTLSGALLGFVGCYQLWKTAPSIFIDVALSFLLYKLSVVSSELHRQDKSNSLTTRLKFGTMILKDIRKNYVLLDAIRMPVFLLYICAFLFDIAGVKKYGRSGLISIVNLLKMRGGVQEICRIMWYPGYVSPYDMMMVRRCEQAILSQFSGEWRYRTQF